ncbi:MAG TPA: hypothetical protein VGR31_11515 [Planctomycetota bacterium]|jgi:hypothetical protein|nr:hypothetical protein [Planctomycetota bacterium]
MQAPRSARTLARAAAPAGFASIALCALSSSSRAQIHFSIDYKGMTIGTPATGSGVPITEGDILVPAAPGMLPAYGPLPPPMIFASGGFGPPAPGLGLPAHPGCIGHPPAFPCGVEVDALSYGMDYAVPRRPLPAGTYVFSVDECSSGFPGFPLPANVFTEAPVGDAAADIFEDLGLPPGPLPPGPPVGNTGIVDGNGFVSASGFVYPGVGIIEPTFPVAGPTGDDIDALEMDSAGPGPLGVFFSLDAAFINPCLGIPNTGSAMANGFLPGMVLNTVAPGGPPMVYAPPPLLGLDIFGPGTDDLDALALAENGIPGFQPSALPYDWTLAGGPDMLLYSVRRGSAVVGMPDSFFGIPIEPGDILTTPVAGGMSPFPAIFIAAEQLGLSTLRSGGGPVADLDALDTRVIGQTGIPYCFGTAALCPCANAGAPGHGCANSAFPAGALLTATGTASVAADTVSLVSSNVPPGKLTLYFQGTTRTGGGFGITLNDGVLCVGGPGIIRLGTHPASATGGSFYPDVGLGQLPVSVKGAIPAAGGTRHYAVWHRDPTAFCTAATSNYSNGLTLVWTP